MLFLNFAYGTTYGVVELGEVEISYSTGTGARSAALIGARERKHTLRW